MNTKKNKTLLMIALLASGLGCGYSSPKMPTPAISQLSPSSVTAGSGQFQLEVDGSNFATGAVINFNGVAESTTIMNSSTLVAMIPGSAIATARTVPVTVTNPSSGGMYGNTGSVTSAPMNFTIH